MKGLYGLEDCSICGNVMLMVVVGEVGWSAVWWCWGGGGCRGGYPLSVGSKVIAPGHPQVRAGLDDSC